MRLINDPFHKETLVLLMKSFGEKMGQTIESNPKLLTNNLLLYLEKNGITMEMLQKCNAMKAVLIFIYIDST